MEESKKSFEEVIKPEDRLSEELMEDVLGGAVCKSGQIVLCNPTGES